MVKRKPVSSSAKNSQKGVSKPHIDENYRDGVDRWTAITQFMRCDLEEDFTQNDVTVHIHNIIEQTVGILLSYREFRNTYVSGLKGRAGFFKDIFCRNTKRPLRFLPETFFAEFMVHPLGLLLFHRLTWNNGIYFDEIPRFLCSRHDVWDMQFLLSKPSYEDEGFIQVEDPERVSRWAIARRSNNLEENKPKWNAFSKDIVAGLQAALSIMEHRVHGEQFDNNRRTVNDKLCDDLTTIIKAYGKWADYLGSKRASFYVPRITCSPFYPRSSSLPFGDGMVITPAKHPVWDDPVFNTSEIQGKKVSYWRNADGLPVDIFGSARNPDEYITLKRLDELAAENQERLLGLKIGESQI